jgi:hypothetical protein
MLTWSNPEKLSAYRSTFRKPGIYIIGGVRDSMLEITGSGEDNPYLKKNWPNNFIPYYVGISESRNTGVRGRLRAHRRGKGSKGIARRLVAGEQLYFIAAHGEDFVSYEPLFLCLKTTGQFNDNVRPEIDRDAKRRFKKARASMSQYERDYYDGLDYNGRVL